MDTPNHHAGRRRWSGRRPRSFIASEVLTRVGEGLSCCQYSSKTRQVQQRRRDLTCSSKMLPKPALRFARDEEAAGSNPVTPTSIPAGQRPYPFRGGAFGLARTATKYRNGAHRNSSEGLPPACAALRWPPSIWSAHRSPTSSSTQFQAATGTGRLVSGRPSAGRLSAPVSQPRAARAIETASTAAAPARCRSCQPGGAFNRALTMPREAVATTRATSAAASARAPDGTDQCRQACTAKVSRAVPASTATARWIRCRATIPPGWPDGQSGKLAQAFSASALTTNEPETNNSPAALMAVQPSLPSRRPVV